MNSCELSETIIKCMKLTDIKYFVVSIFSLLEYYYNLNNIKLDINSSILSLGTYDYIHHCININLNRIKNNEEFKNVKNKDLLLKILIVSVLAHEMYHAKQFYLVNSPYQTLESQLIKLLDKENAILSSPYLRYYYQNNGLFNDILAKRRFYYYNYYDINPMERMANYSSRMISLDVTKKMEISDIYNMLLKSDNLLRLDGYIKINNIIAPIFEFAHKLNLSNELESLLNEYNIYDTQLDFRLGYGLPITIEEYNYQKVKKS